MSALTSVIGRQVILRLREEAKKDGFTELSRKTGMNRGHLYQALEDDANPSLDTLVKIALALGFVIDVKPEGKK